MFVRIRSRLKFYLYLCLEKGDSNFRFKNHVKGSDCQIGRCRESLRLSLSLYITLL